MRIRSGSILAMALWAVTGPASSAGAEGRSVMGSSARDEMKAQAVEAEDAFFGQYRLRMGLERVSFGDGMRYYDKLYGSESLMYGFGVDWFPSSWTPPFLAVGGAFRASYYTDNGHVSLSRTAVKADDERATELKVLPLQAGLIAEFTILPEKWIVVDAWSVMERAYYQEARIASDTEDAAWLRLATEADSSEEDDADALVNRGWKNGIANGVAVNILLNFLDESSVRSQRGALGLGYIYLTLYTQNVMDAGSTGMNFGRNSAGVAFTFEAVH